MWETRILSLLCLMSFISSGSLDPIIGTVQPEVGMTVEQVITYYGYPVENHTIQTEDGYLLKVTRIPYGKSGPGASPGKPIFVQHGFLANSACWIFNKPENSLGFILADNGYDVWLGNMRGTPGTGHVNMTVKDTKFWEFSFDEMAKYDLPATFDYMLNKTNVPQLHYVGHSMGTIMIMALLSTKVEYNAKIKVAVLLAPAATFEYVTKPPVVLLKDPILGTTFFTILENMDDGSFNLSNSFISKMKDAVCLTQLASSTLCKSVFYFLFGADDAQLDQTRIGVYSHFLPQTTSVRTFKHVVQEMKSKKFQHFDFGPECNLEKYKQVTPLEYDATKIEAPVALYVGPNDWWATPQDNAKLSFKIKNLFRNVTVDFSKYTHTDFLWAKDNNDLLHNKVLDTLKAFP